MSRGLVQIAGLTPSDALHALEQHDVWDRDAASKGLQLFGRQRDGSGQAFCSDPQQLAARIVARVERRSAEVVLETAFQNDGKDGAELLQHPLVTETLDQRASKDDSSKSRTAQISLKLDRPLIGLGASAHVYHPAVAGLLETQVKVPKDADVANAIGAVVGQVMMKAEFVVSQPAEGRFQVTGLDQPFVNEAEAMKEAETMALARARMLAQEAGAQEVEINLSRDIKRASVESRDMLVEARIVATATGRPPIAD